ncbi:LamG domain-containing protein [Saccharicrinis sp. 156]|uniref:LamG domain-containing protein n=1 Tax=Saccharicrinis sp. 156 TaxID=3417574 RepID=UPI003D33DA00
MRILMKSGILSFFLTVLIQLASVAQDAVPISSWDFSEIKNRTVIEAESGIADTLEGNFATAPGIKGQGLRLDGFTTRIVRKEKYIQEPGSKLTIEAWVALGEYPLNWCPVVTTESNEVKGYRLLIGPHGQVSFETAISEKWMSTTSAHVTIPLRKWMHITGVYTAQKDIKLYVNGELVSSRKIEGSITFPKKTNCILGMVPEPLRPSNTIRTWGTIPAYYGLDGIIDEIKIFDTALTADHIKGNFIKYEIVDPDIEVRRLPVVENNPNRFGAFYTKLNYYPGWDLLWPVDQDPDIVVCFENNPVKFIFWRGIRYGPCWVSENENWMADQSLETWGNGKNDIEGCFEHMQDRHCRFSHVRIIENTEARAVVHWRYAPVSAHDHTWKPDPKTGWECWVDEYYYIYPDGSAIRKVSWNKGSAGHPVQLQESLPLTQPGQRSEEVVKDNYVTVADYDYYTCPVSVDENKKPTNWKGDNTIQQFNFKAKNKPYICFEPGNRMSVRWINGGYNHFPVNQARSDGRWAKTVDRPSHFMSSPCSDPVIHKKGNRLFWFGLYGMNDMNMHELISFGRSWAYAPEISVKGGDYVSNGYDKSEKCYRLESKYTKTQKLELCLAGSQQNPICNPAFIIKNWNADKAAVMLNGKPLKEAKTSIVHELEADKLVVFLFLEKKESVNITIHPK